MAKILDQQGRLVATADPETGRWTWVNRDLAPEAFAALVDQPDLMSKDGGFKDGICYTQFLTLQRGTPEWLADILGRMYNGYHPDLQWHD